DPGVCRESGLDPVEVMRMMGNQMNHSHYRNVILHEPYSVYDEVFYDLGQNNMFAVMREYFNIGYKLYIFPEHSQHFTRDAAPGDTRKRPLGGTSGNIYNVAYTRAMLQAAMSI
ncbi:MAG: mannonate dehydratase, partial [Bacteroidales bacterium]|nr:mannonate dehydratase [Bacteroidales bacterium]